MKLDIIDPATGAQILNKGLTNGLVTIGRKSSCSFNVSGSYGSISGVHATLRSSGSSVEIIDGDGKKASKNGIFINGKRIPHETWVAIAPGDKISLGIPSASGTLQLNLSGSEVNNRLNAGSPNPTTIGVKNNPQQVVAPTVMTASPADKYSISPRKSHGNSTLSSQMISRIERIDQYLRNGYKLDKSSIGFPAFVSQGGRRQSINLFSNPAGFSWIAFFFGFAVYAQIREWNFFYILGITDFVVSLISVAIRVDITWGASIGLYVTYGMLFPYYRYLALSNSLPEIGKSRSILIGILLSFIAVFPGTLLTSYLLP